MTAELIVMNKNGVALAADSAVTVSSGGKTTKVYNTANKLFSLSKYRPVGVMIYGSAEIMGLPWEIVIKRYREQLGSKSFSTLQEYIDDLFLHLKNHAFQPSCYEAYVKQRSMEIFRVVEGEVDTQVEQEIKDKGEIEESCIEQIHKDCVIDIYNKVKEAQKDFGIKNKDVQESMQNHRELVVDTINSVLGNRPIKGAVKRKLVDACLLAAIIFPGMNQSGLVISGFGDDEVFPGAKAFEIHKILDGNIQFVPTYEASVALNDTVHIKAFAQSNETQNFMNGISGSINEYIQTDMKSVLSSAFGDTVTDLLIEDGIVPKNKSAECKDRLNSAGKGVFAYVDRGITEISKREFSGPVVSAVAFFSPTEMAAMAETLVNLESFRQQVTLRSETVGGPIDVSVITRGDGFVWMKRKHYFSPDLNHQFLVLLGRASKDSVLSIGWASHRS